MTTTATILLVEDDQSLLDGISDLLEVVDLGYEVTVLTASNGWEGLDLMADRTPDLVISDIMMPKMGGFEFLERLRKNSAWVHIPVIFLSARGTKEDIRAGRISGAELYITKPFDNEELLEMVRSQLDRTFELKFDRERRLDNLQRNIIQLLNHEFRTPLTYVTAYYEMLEDGLTNQNIENIQEYLRGIQVGAMRMTRLIDNFVRVIELRTGEAVESFNERAEPIENLPEILEAICREWQSGSEDEYQLQCQIPSDLPPIYGDSTYLWDIIDRLVDNAVKFSSKKLVQSPKILVSAEGHEDEVHISVQDNGIGFPEHIQNQLFDLFFQHDRELMEQQGSGSGLTVVKGLVELHNGRIEVQSRVDQGSTFTVCLPIYSTEAADMAYPTKRAVRMKKSATILLVEDEWYLLEGLRELLEVFECDYELSALTATNGVEALEVLRDHKPDLIVTDIMMPKMGGYEFLAEVRNNPALIHIPVIFLTARGERQDVIRGRSSGAEEYIVKPYDSDELLELVVKQLDRYFQRQGAMRQDFDELKRGILNLLQPDFRNPLTSVSDYSQKMAVALEDVQTEEEMGESLKGIQSASRRITRLVEDFIFLAELRTGEAVGSFGLTSRPTNTGLLLLEVYDLSRLTAEQYDISINNQVEISLPMAKVDYDRLKTAIQRLLNMLVEYCAFYHRGSVTIGSKSDNEKIHLILEVNDISFSSEKVEQFKHLFSQQDVTGLELPEHDPDLVVTKGIVDLHKGQIQIESVPGQYSRFIISLPIYNPANDIEHP